MGCSKGDESRVPKKGMGPDSRGKKARARMSANVGRSEAVDGKTGTLSMVASPENARVAREIAGALAATGRGPLRSVSVSVADGVITLRGRVPSYYLKQLAQTAALRLCGERGLYNEVDVA